MHIPPPHPPPFAEVKPSSLNTVLKFVYLTSPFLSGAPLPEKNPGSALMCLLRPLEIVLLLNDNY